MDIESRHITLTQEENEVLGIASFCLSRFSNPHADRHLRYGFIRRLFMMQTSRISIYEIVERQGKTPLQHKENYELIINLNSCYTNLRGILDNLAWILAYELGLRDPISEEPGKGTSRHFCDLFGDEFLEALSSKAPELAAELGGYSDWYSEIKNLRDPSAHRIPLSFITSILNEEEQKEHDRKMEEHNRIIMQLDKVKTEDALRLTDEALELFSKANQIGTFQPIIVTSEASGHELRSAPDQLQTDQEKLLEIGKMVLSELLN